MNKQSRRQSQYEYREVWLNPRRSSQVARCPFCFHVIKAQLLQAEDSMRVLTRSAACHHAWASGANPNEPSLVFRRARRRSNSHGKARGREARDYRSV
jgi:hypothetical protein